MSNQERVNLPKTPTGNGRFGLLLSGALSAGLLASACCTIPLLLVVAGVGGAWLSTMKALEPLRPLFIVLAASLLFYAFSRSQNAPAEEVCEPGGDCANPAVRKRNRILLWMGAMATILLIGSPSLIGWFFS